VLAAVVTVVVADRIATRLSPPRHQREIVDAVRDYQHEDPTVLVLGSSHARSFAVVDDLARERTQGRVRVLDVPLEWGKFRSYEWVLQHRLRPFIEEQRGGALARPSLRYFVLQTAWWDACGLDTDPPVFNLPSRAWTLRRFVEGVFDSGYSDYSRNYVPSRWLEIFSGSTLVTDRGHWHLRDAIRDTVRPLPESVKRARYEKKLVSWKAMIDRGSQCMGYPDEIASAQRIIDYAKSRGYDVTLLLYPMMPITFSQHAHQQVQAPFYEIAKRLAEKNGIRFIDTTFPAELTDADYQPDFDHLTPAGHRKYSELLLKGPLSFVLGEEPGHAASAEADGGAAR
jgi:hypothetical protein